MRQLLEPRIVAANDGLGLLIRCFGCFTMDVIASVGFGTQIDSQNNPSDPFVYHAQKFFSFTFFRPLVMLFVVFPVLISPLAGLLPNKSRDEVNTFFINCIKKIIKQRDEQPAIQRRRDFLQLMLDVRSGQECAALEQFDMVNQAEEGAPPHRGASAGRERSEEGPRHVPKRIMTEDEIVGQAFIFLLAGYETSSSTLAFVGYLMAVHPECQEKLQREVDDFFSRHVSDSSVPLDRLLFLLSMFFAVSRRPLACLDSFRPNRSSLTFYTLIGGSLVARHSRVNHSRGFIH
ncbi:hypothetical protein Z043_109775 [Scleropages formosus]|uniref:Cytochrome P450 3A n=1 Tax=Scleropages formosus TaxID=113540 RepID=A0A0P7YUA6_SCLFO|nr:hypothetical protein Z043_109775 [Scleropages formosus]